MHGIAKSSRIAKSHRCGFTFTDVLIVAVVVGLLICILTPAILSFRERSRLNACQQNLREIGAGLAQYHEVHRSFPPAAVWRGDGLRTIMLKDVEQIDLITYENWSQLILPQVGLADIAAKFDASQPIMAVVNESGRMTSISKYNCPADYFNRSDNLYAYQMRPDSDSVVSLARGNYAINGGTQNLRYHPETPAQPRFDGLQIVLDHKNRRFEFVGNGIAGINRSFSDSDFQNGKSTLVAVEEIRAGIHPIDPRGVWSLGQIGGSITFAHGVSSDDYGPNNQWDRADDILGCQRLHETLGSETLLKERMPCVHYADQNNQATARSLHANGVNVLFLDGAVRFVNDHVDPGLWHVMHSRETPASLLEDSIPVRLGPYQPPSDAVAELPTLLERKPGEVVTNSIGMGLVVIPSGEFVMGIPDVGFGVAPPECPPHKVSITYSFLLGQHEVTQSQFERIMRRNPSFHNSEMASVANTTEFPVESVSWDDAAEFCKRLSVLPEEVSAGRRYRLPTEAEWEYACRAGQQMPHNLSTHRRADDDSGENAGMIPSLPISRVGSYRPNSFGVYDMRGNVWEWTNDWFDRSYYSRSPSKDPQGPASGFIKVVRGGDWTFVGEPCHINYAMTPPWKASPYLGFRVVCVLFRESE